MSRFYIEVPPSPFPFAARPDPDRLAQAIAGLITGSGTVSAVGTDGGGFLITAELDLGDAVEDHQSTANALLSAVSRLGLYAARLIATRLATRAVEGFLTGALGGLGLGASQKSELTPVIGVLSAIAGGIIGNFVEREIQLFEWRRDAAGRWYDTREQQPYGNWGWQPI